MFKGISIGWPWPSTTWSSKMLVFHNITWFLSFCLQKINATNAFEVPLVNVREMSDFLSNLNFQTLSFKSRIDQDGNSWKNLSTALESTAKVYGFRVDSVFNEVHKVLGGLNRSLGEDGKDNFEESEGFYLHKDFWMKLFWIKRETSRGEKLC